MSKNRAIATNPRDAVSKYVRACQIAYDIKDIVEYRDGLASFPAYLLEQLWDELGIPFERHYTETKHEQEIEG